MNVQPLANVEFMRNGNPYTVERWSIGQKDDLYIVQGSGGYDGYVKREFLDRLEAIKYYRASVSDAAWRELERLV